MARSGPPRAVNDKLIAAPSWLPGFCGCFGYGAGTKVSAQRLSGQQRQQGDEHDHTDQERYEEGPAHTDSNTGQR